MICHALQWCGGISGAAVRIHGGVLIEGIRAIADARLNDIACDEEDATMRFVGSNGLRSR